MELRRLNLSDLEFCFANRLRALSLSPDAFLSTLEEEKARGHALYERGLAQAGSEQAIFGAVTETAVVGTVGILRERDRPKTRHIAVIWGVYVDVSQRGKGIAGALLDLAISFATEEMKATVIKLSVLSNNPEARRLYESRGFRQWGTEPRAVRTGGVYHSEDHFSLEL